MRTHSIVAREERGVGGDVNVVAECKDCGTRSAAYREGESGGRGAAAAPPTGGAAVTPDSVPDWGYAPKTRSLCKRIADELGVPAGTPNRGEVAWRRRHESQAWRRAVVAENERRRLDDLRNKAWEEKQRQLRAWFPAAWRRVCAALRRAGYRRCYRSDGSAYYELRTADGRRVIRVSDHQLPLTPEREHNHCMGWQAAETEVVLDRVMSDEDLERAIAAAIAGEDEDDDGEEQNVE